MRPVVLFDEFAAALPEDLFKSHQNGLAVTFTANNNGKSLTIEVPGKVVVEELAAVDTVRAALPRADAAPPPTPGAFRDASCAGRRHCASAIGDIVRAL